jgi:hypothetical protein
MTEFMRHGPSVKVAGGYWEKYPALRTHALGLKPPEIIHALTAAAKVNLCLVRRANRDGHVMRSFEIAAIGGCMLVEDTEEHRAIFGGDGSSRIPRSTAPSLVAMATRYVISARRSKQPRLLTSSSTIRLSARGWLRRSATVSVAMLILIAIVCVLC